MHKITLSIIASLSLVGSIFAYESGSSVSEKQAEISNQADQKKLGYTYGQCQGTTKAGNRCKRGVSNSGDTRCYQH